PRGLHGRLAGPGGAGAVRAFGERSRRGGLACLATLAWVVLVLGSCAPRKHEGVTLRFWAMGREGEVVVDLVRDFERENPGVHVEVQQIPWGAAHEKLLTSHVG